MPTIRQVFPQPGTSIKKSVAAGFIRRNQPVAAIAIPIGIP
jgi:hypothetical protein